MRPSKTLSKPFFHRLITVSLFLFFFPTGCVLPGIRADAWTAEKIKTVQILVLEGASVDDTHLLLRSWREAGFNTAILRAFHFAGDVKEIVEN